jgi:hypothetical protein
MSLSSNNLSKILLKTYMSQINSDGNIGAGSDIKGVDQEKLLQQFAFQMVLGQMMDSMGSSDMSDLLSAALNGQESMDSENSLSLMGNLNANVRNTSNLQLNNISYGKESEIISHEGLGGISSKYESSGNPGAISNTPGDYGGKSYGTWQFSSKTGSLNSFVNWLKENHSDFYSKLASAKSQDGNAFGVNFDEAWTSISKASRSQFFNAQSDYVKQAFYDRAAVTLKKRIGFNIDGRSNALKESLWSTVVQHGVGGAVNIFSKLNLNGSDRQIINELYSERQKVNIYFRSSSERVRQSVYNRFSRERVDMLNMLGGEEV